MHLSLGTKGVHATRMEPVFGKSLLVAPMAYAIAVAILRNCAVRGIRAMSVASVDQTAYVIFVVIPTILVVRGLYAEMAANVDPMVFAAFVVGRAIHAA